MFMYKVMHMHIKFSYIYKIEATGSTFACAFESGVIRIIAVAISTANAINNIRGDYVRLIQVVKPHKMAITAMSLNPSCRYNRKRDFIFYYSYSCKFLCKIISVYW